MTPLNLTDGLGGGGLSNLGVNLSNNLIDSFEDNDISEYGGDTSEWKIVSSSAIDGSYALAPDTSAQYYNLASTSGLPNYPDTTNIFEAYMYNDDGSGAGNGLGPAWGVQSETGADGVSCYYTYVLPDGSLNVRRIDSGSRTTFSVSDSLSGHTQGDTIRYEIDWRVSGGFDILYDKNDGSETATVSISDTNYTSGGIGWWCNVGSDIPVYYGDYYRILS